MKYDYTKSVYVFIKTQMGIERIFHDGVCIARRAPDGKWRSSFSLTDTADYFSLSPVIERKTFDSLEELWMEFL